MVEDRLRRAADVASHDEHLVEDRDRLFVPAQLAQGERFEASAAKQRLRDVLFTGERACPPRQLERSFVLTDPVRRVGVEVEMLDEIERSAAGTPPSEGVAPEPQGPLDVAVGPAHSELLTLHREDGRL